MPAGSVSETRWPATGAHDWDHEAEPTGACPGHTSVKDLPLRVPPLTSVPWHPGVTGVLSTF